MTANTSRVSRKEANTPKPRRQRKPYTGHIPIPEKYHCLAEQRSRRFQIDLEYEDIGDELMNLRKQAFDLYGATCLWNIPGDATIDGMRSVAKGLRNYGDLKAAHLAIEILVKTGWNEFYAA